MRIRVHKIRSMRIRIQDNKITKLISNNLLIVKKKNIFYLFLLILDLDLKYIISCEKKSKICWLYSVFPFILHLWIRTRIRNTHPDPRTQMNANPTGSESTSLARSICCYNVNDSEEYIRGTGKLCNFISNLLLFAFKSGMMIRIFFLGSGAAKKNRIRIKP